MKGIKETNTITTISSSEEEESAVAGYISEDYLSVIDEGETVGRGLDFKMDGWHLLLSAPCHSFCGPARVPPHST